MRVIISLITPFFTPLSFIVLLPSRAFHTYSQSELPLSFSVPLLALFFVYTYCPACKSLSLSHISQLQKI